MEEKKNETQKNSGTNFCFCEKKIPFVQINDFFSSVRRVNVGNSKCLMENRVRFEGFLSDFFENKRRVNLSNL